MLTLSNAIARQIHPPRLWTARKTLSTLVTEDPNNKLLKARVEYSKYPLTSRRTTGVNQFVKQVLSEGIENSIKSNERVKEISAQKPVSAAHVGGFKLLFPYNGKTHNIPEELNILAKTLIDSDSTI